MNTNANVKPAAAAPAVAATKPAAESAKGNTATEGTKPAEAAPAEPAKPDPFANLPVITLAETNDVVDMSGVTCTQPYKYDKVHTDALADKLPLRRGWKHSTAMFVPGTFKGGENGFRAGSVYGTIADIVTRAGRAGLTAHELVTQVRIRQIGNKRSKYCEKLPPVGWAEGWINTAVTKNIIGVHATKRAPALMVPPAPAEEAKPDQKAAA